MIAEVLKRREINDWSFLAPLKLIAFVMVLLVFIAHHFLASLIISDQEKRNHYYLKGVVRYAKLALLLLNIKVDHEPTGRDVRGSLIVANHLSYVDVLVLAVLYPSLFITSQEIKETFLLGQVTSLAGCFFVERRPFRITADSKVKELSEIKEMLEKGFNILLFPEGTSSDGHRVLPFKQRFFQLAIDLDLGALPLVVKYQGPSQEIVPWYGSMTFLDHLFRVCLLKKIEVSVTELPLVKGENKSELAHMTHLLISETYGKN